MGKLEHQTAWIWQPAGAFGTATHGLPGPDLVRIGVHLRALYDEVLEEPVPDRLRQLVARLEQRRA